MGDVAPAETVGKRGYSRPLLRAIDQAIEVYEEDRSQSIAAWRQTLPASILEGRSLPAPEPGTGDAQHLEPVTPPSSRSSRWAAVVGAVVLIVAIAGGAYWLGQRTPVVPTEQAAVPTSAVSDQQQPESSVSQETASASPEKEEPVVAPAPVVPEPAPAPLDPVAIETALGLEREERVLIQQGLMEAGQEPGPADGLFGGETTRTRQAIRAWQATKGLEETGYLTREQAETLLAVGQEAGEARRVAEAQAADDRAYAEVQQEDTATAYEDYLAAYPQGRHAEAARQAAQAAAEREAQEAAVRQAQAADDAAYAQAQRIDTVAAYADYLRAYPQGQHADEARTRQAAREEAVRRAQEAARQAQADDAAYAAAQRADTVEGYEEYLQAYPQGRHAAEARQRQQQRQWRVGQTFRDALRSGGQGPEMVVVPAGSFLMGCVSGRGCRFVVDDEPVHRVTIAQPFAVGQYEVTFGEWDGCMASGGCKGYRPKDEGWGRGRWPVIHVSWEDAQAYVTWLSDQTGQEYRLLSEAEWEYVARAGTTTPYWWGDEVGRNRANCYGCGSQWEPVFKGIIDIGGQTAPVGSFAANGWGLHDVHGNVGEWIQDCGGRGYADAPSDGRARESEDCFRRALRGGSWNDHPSWLRSAFRFSYTADIRNNVNGFRIARSLP